MGFDLKKPVVKVLMLKGEKGGADWGNINGDINDQTDLQTALNGLQADLQTALNGLQADLQDGMDGLQDDLDGLQDSLDQKMNSSDAVIITNGEIDNIVGY